MTFFKGEKIPFRRFWILTVSGYTGGIKSVTGIGTMTTELATKIELLCISKGEIGPSS